MGKIIHLIFPLVVAIAVSFLLGWGAAVSRERLLTRTDVIMAYHIGRVESHTFLSGRIAEHFDELMRSGYSHGTDSDSRQRISDSYKTLISLSIDLDGRAAIAAVDRYNNNEVGKRRMEKVMHSIVMEDENMLGPMLDTSERYLISNILDPLKGVMKWKADNLVGHRLKTPAEIWRASP